MTAKARPDDLVKCRTCEKTKPALEFGVISSSFGRRRQCRQCQNLSRIGKRPRLRDAGIEWERMICFDHTQWRDELNKINDAPTPIDNRRKHPLDIDERGTDNDDEGSVEKTV